MDLASLKFLNPQFLWLLWVLPLLAVSMVWFAWARQKRTAENFGEWHLYAKFSQLVTKVRYAFRAVALAGAVAALIVAMAGADGCDDRVSDRHYRCCGSGRR